VPREITRVKSGEMPHILKKIITEAHKLNFYFTTQNNDEDYDGECGKK
jgi:hypothetical protein